MWRLGPSPNHSIMPGRALGGLPLPAGSRSPAGPLFPWRLVRLGPRPWTPSAALPLPTRPSCLSRRTWRAVCACGLRCSSRHRGPFGATSSWILLISFDRLWFGGICIRLPPRRPPARRNARSTTLRRGDRGLLPRGILTSNPSAPAAFRQPATRRPAPSRPLSTRVRPLPFGRSPAVPYLHPTC